MSHVTRIRRFRHPLLSILIALFLFVTVTPLQPPGSQPISPPSPPLSVMLPTTRLSQPPTTAGPPPTAPQLQGATTDNFYVYLPRLTHTEVATFEVQVNSRKSEDQPLCREYRDIRITWYELGSCCNKSPSHPAYGITRSGLTVQWGMAAVQADTPLVPLGTTVMIKDLGPIYPMVVTDTGSETAFGSAWLDVYAPSEAIGYWLEEQIGRDGRSDVLVCPTSSK